MKFAKICCVLAMALVVLAACNTRNRTNVPHTNNVPDVNHSTNVVPGTVDGTTRNHIVDGNRVGNNIVDGNTYDGNYDGHVDDLGRVDGAYTTDGNRAHTDGANTLNGSRVDGNTGGRAHTDGNRAHTGGANNLKGSRVDGNTGGRARTDGNHISGRAHSGGAQAGDNRSFSAPSFSHHESANPAVPAMSTDFVEIGALDSKKLGWGSGGPTDDHGRPEGATLFQRKYGKHGAYFITPAGSNVYLTFDEGYENGFTPRILDTLKRKNVKAVFFITIDFAQNQQDLVKRMIDEGHIIGNHSCKHLSFPDMNLKDAAEDIMKLHDYVKATYGYEMHLFRPPMGEFSEQTLALAQSLGYKSVFWSVAYKDYDVKNQPSTVEALHDLTNKTHPGAIFLLHGVSNTNAEILDDLIDNVRAKGYQFARWDW